MIEKKRTFGVIDTDRSPKLIEQGNYVAALNIRNSASTGNQVGVIENVKGNELFTFNLPAGINEVIGAYSHEEENIIYYYVWNQLEQHQVVRFNYVLEAFQVVLRTPELKFQRLNHIVESEIIEGQLFFNDTRNEVRRLDIAECISYQDAQVWDFIATEINGDNQVELQGTSPPPFTVGQQITVVRDWRSAWIDHNPPAGLGEDAGYAASHRFDPNPEYSDTQQVLAINGNNVILQVGPTGVQDFLDYDGQQSFIGGRAYLRLANRMFTVPILENDIKLYRQNPPYPVVAAYGSDESRKVNNLRGRLFQFKTRYVYPNGMRSVPSPICKIPLPRFEKNIPFQDLPVWQDNYIDLKFDTGRHDVVAIEILARESSSEVNQDWSLVRKIDKEDLGVRSNTSYSFRFFGDEVQITLPIAEGTQPMDYIPHRGQAFCFIRDKRNAIGGCDEGFDHVDVDVDVSKIGIRTLNSVGFIQISTPGIDSQSTTDEAGLPIETTAWYPLNTNQTALSPLHLSTALIPQSVNSVTNYPYWAATPYAANASGFPTSGNFTAFRFSWPINPSTGTEPALPNPVAAGWQFLGDSPAFIGFPNQDLFPWYKPYVYSIGNPGTHPWAALRFRIVNAQGVVPGPINTLSAEGNSVSITVSFRVSKNMAFMLSNPLLGTLAQSPPLAEIGETTNGNTLTFPGVISLNTFPQDSSGSYYEFSKTYSKVLSASDTFLTVRDHFIDAIDGDTDLTADVDITLATYVIIGGGNNYQWRSRRITASVSIQASSDGGFPAAPTGTTAISGIMFVRPTIELENFSTSDQGFPANEGLVSLLRLRSWFSAVGVNKITVRSSTTSPDGGRGFKTGANHLLALEYRDGVGRRATVSPVDLQYIPYFNENPAFGATGVAMLFRINNPAPLWATHYQFMYAGNMSMFDWLQFEVAYIDLSDSNEGVKIALTQRTNQYNRENNLGLVSNVTEIGGRSNISYSWSRGDRLRFRTYWTGSQTEGDGDAIDDIPAGEFVDMEIIGEGTDTTSSPPSYAPFGTVIIVKKDDILPYIDAESIGRGSLIEVYTPKDTLEDDQVIYREIGEAFKVTNQSHHGNRLNQGPNTPGADSPFAEVLIKNNGDAYAIGRAKISGSTRSRARLVESSSFSDFYPSYGWGPGVANRFDPDAKRRVRKELIRYSDFLIRQANGLNRYFDGNVSDEPDVIHGLIQRMECPETNLYVFQELSTGLMPVRALELMSASGDNILMRSDNVIGNISYIPGGVGIGDNREALTYFLGRFFWPSIANGKFLALSGTSIDTISAYNKEHFWNNVSNMIKKSRTKVRILTEYDASMDELLVFIPGFFVGIPEVGARPDFQNMTLAFSPKKKGWTTEYGFHPEVMLRHNNKIISWKRGQLYVHDETEEWNQFYEGEPAVRSRITLSFNSEIDAVKFLQSILLESTREPDEIEIETDYGAGQITGLFKDDFRYSENQYSAAILRDENSPGGILGGDVMRGESCLVTVEFDPTDQFKLFSVNLRYEKSEMTDR